MNIFKIHRGIRKVGHNYGLPVWFVDCGLGVSYKPEELLRKLATLGLHKTDWVVVRGGMSERGVGTFVDALKYVGCRVEVEAGGSDPTPAWYTKADRWTIYWDGNTVFNFGAMRRGQDMLVGKDDSFLDEMGSDDKLDKGFISNGTVNFDKLWAGKVRVYDNVE